MVARLPVAYEQASRPQLRRRPVAVAQPDGTTLWSVSPVAAAEGVVEGQRLSEALGRCPSLVVVDARPARYEELHASLLDAVEQVVPGVESAELGVAYVDLASVRRSPGSAERLHAELLGCVPPALHPALGVGSTKFVARLAAAREGAPVQVVTADAVDDFLAPVAVTALPVDAEVVRRLRMVGITTVGQVARLRRRALVAQLGAAGARLVDLLDGVDEPVRPRPHVEQVAEALHPAEPLSGRDALLAAGEHVLRRALQHLRSTHRVARQLVVRVETEQAQRWEATVTLRQPSGDHDRVWLTLAPVLERAVLPGPAAALVVELHELRGAQGWQDELELSERGRRASQERVEESLRQLQARYGGRRVVGKMAPLDPRNRIPERRWALVDHD
jgi:nucleotidyltransferase/DNA polymerase involved in DNA repair